LLTAGILLCAALAAFYAPPIIFPNVTYISTSATAASTASVQTKQVGNIFATLLLLPGHVDSANTLVVVLTNSDGQTITDAQLRIRINMETMDMGTARAVLKASGSTYTATFARGEGFSMAGLWDIGLSIQRPGQPDAQVTFQVNVT
jgi:hypothetical protein